MKRREAIIKGTLGAGAISTFMSTKKNKDMSPITKSKLAGNINHSVCRWCYNSLSLDELWEGAQDIGIKSIDLTTPDEWATIKKYGLTCAMASHKDQSLTEGFNHPEYHARLIPMYLELIDRAAEAGMPNVIVFSGNRAGISDEQGLENCAIGLDKVVKHAQQKDVVVVMELLNSKINHKDYQCDHTPWGAALVDKIGSAHFKLLYDIYHMQIMEGDIIHTIQDYKDYIAHYHTGGVPGRNEINDSQELNYPAIMQAIVDTGYKGYVAQEFIPTYADKLAALKEGVLICDV
jgi:hydroxypyruvate isomerase